ncbi:hypothetical protein L228DRAFT_249963 [Xylona heveae TC161]|uniref:AMP-dependent synthetase/ligase domain-containing protein n=1 Tax=Xylona heveae (strain CBS 132557 / TC161) TaxID=1328760 RepID=A0A165ADD3_XYLHT|nr:hypothetical protein L228DRAFT_249963 [Xylona heveae TC161]KZF20292.1 hypothetical protein L228DRAFT_249963 [Xylona heveae TC161]
MSQVPNKIEQLDAQFAELLSGWSIYTTILVILISAYVVLPWWFSKDPDLHPILLSRQATPAPVRNAGESATYRSVETPYGFPLKSGLGVKDPGAPRWARGRDGDLRDIWKQAARDPLDQTGQSTGQPGKILTVLGKEEVIEHNLADISRSISIVGSSVQTSNGKRVAIHLPNSLELLTTIFAGSFYGFTVILIPHHQSPSSLFKLLAQTGADTLVSEAGVVPLSDLVERCPSLKSVFLVVEATSRHIDWNPSAEETKGKLSVSIWHELVENGPKDLPLPDNLPEASETKIVTVWEGKNSEERLVEFSQKNLAAAVAALITSLPARERLNPKDLFLPVDSLCSSYPLSLTLAALYSHASVALNSVAGKGIDLALATRNISPTVIAVSAETAAAAHRLAKGSSSTLLRKYSHWLQIRSLKAGVMPRPGLLSSFNATSRPSVGETPGKLRIMYVAERAGTDSPPLSSSDLNDLRVFTGARIVYALTAEKVAGAVAQTNLYDYRRENGPTRNQSHFGGPLSSVEVKVVDTPSHKTLDQGQPQGEIVVRGPAVFGGEASLGVNGVFRDDHTLAYV